MQEAQALFQYQEKYAKAFFETFLISLIICLLPIKALGFIIPFVCITYFLLRTKSGKGFQIFFLLASLWGIILLFYNWYSDQIGLSFNTSNGILSYFHYSSFIFILAFPHILTSSTYKYERYAKILLAVILFEGCYGIMQRVLTLVIKGANYGDVVEGTLNPLSFIYSHSGFSNQFYTINMLVFMAFCFPLVYKTKRKFLSFFIGLIAVVLASVGHVFYSFAFALTVTFFVFEASNIILKPRNLILFGILAGGMVLLLYNLDPAVVSQASRQFTMFVDGESPKSQALSKAIYDLGSEFPSMHLVGIGPGQYSSRTGIIASGTYGALSDFFTHLPVLKVGLTESFRKYVLEDWLFVERHTDAFGESTMYRPFFSLLSVYTEFGGLMLLIVIAMVSYQIHLLKKRYLRFKKEANHKYLSHLAFSCSSCILFLFFIGIHENYYETPQGIFTGILLILIMKSFLSTEVGLSMKVKDEDGLANVMGKDQLQEVIHQF